MVVDVNRREQRRGTYLCRDAECAARARSKGALARKLRQKIEDYGGLDRWIAANPAALGTEGLK